STHVLTTAYPGAASFDDAQSFSVVRRRDKFFVPTRSLAEAVDTHARAIGAEIVFLDPMLPLGHVGPRLRAAPYGVVGHAAEVTVYGRVPVSRALARRVLRGAVGLVAAGEYVAREAARDAGHALPTLVIPPGVDPERFRPLDDAAKRAARLRFGLDPDRP